MFEAAVSDVKRATKRNFEETVVMYRDGRAPPQPRDDEPPSRRPPPRLDTDEEREMREKHNSIIEHMFVELRGHQMYVELKESFECENIQDLTGLSISADYILQDGLWCCWFILATTGWYAITLDMDYLTQLNDDEDADLIEILHQSKKVKPMKEWIPIYDHEASEEFFRSLNDEDEELGRYWEGAICSSIENRAILESLKHRRVFVGGTAEDGGGLVNISRSHLILDLSINMLFYSRSSYGQIAYIANKSKLSNSLQRSGFYRITTCGTH